MDGKPLYLLHKCSVPAWTKGYWSKREATEELRSHICGLCMTGEEFGNPVPDDYDIDDLLGTACGLEYEFEETP